MPEDPKQKIVRLLKNSTEPKRKPPRRSLGAEVSASGKGNVVAGGDVHLHLSIGKVFWWIQPPAR